jgi:integrase
MGSKRSATNYVLFQQKALDKLPYPKSGRLHYYDEREQGLGLRVEPDRKSFFWFRKVKGQPTFRSIGVFPATSVEKARDTAQEWNGELAESKRHGYEQLPAFLATTRGELTFGELIDQYKEKWLRKEASHPEQAEAHTKWMFEKYLSGFRNRKLSHIERREVRELHEALTKNHGGIIADRVCQLIRRAYNWAMDEKVELFSGENPAAKVAFNGDRPRDRFLQPEELVRLDKALKDETNQDLKDFVELALATGARRGNVLGMEWAQVNEQHWIWSLPRTSTKNQQPLVIPLTARAVAVLKRRAQSRTSSAFVFPSPTSACGHLVEMKRAWQQLLKRAEIADCTIHDLRRTNASYQSIAGQSLQAIASVLGHSDVSATQIYARLNSDAARKSLLAGAETMARAMRSAKRKLARA